MKKITFLLLVSLLFSGCTGIGISAATSTGLLIAQERTVGDAVDDTTIWTEVKHLYLQKDVNDLLQNVSVEVTEGRILLTGNVKLPQTRVEAVRLAWQPRGVKEVINEIQVSDKVSLKDIARDKWITTQIKSKLLLNKDIRSINYTIETVNGTVYLIGIAQNVKELNNVTMTASTVKGVKQVISHVRTKGSPQQAVNTIYN